MTITAKIIADSVSVTGKRITTFQLKYPRFIHSEFMTHRVFSRNASSSRAIPVKTMIKDIHNNPAMPIHWGANISGMQASNELNSIDIKFCEKIWLEAMYRATYFAENLIEAGLHKQVANRILEPFAHINVLVTATEYNNFFNLRNHPDAQPEIQELAKQMLICMHNSEPKLNFGWHLPYIKDSDEDNVINYFLDNNLCYTLKEYDDVLLKISTARCARVSYLTHDLKETSIQDDINLHDKLVSSQPLHSSPSEHQAYPLLEKYDENLQGNFVGWCQYRRTLQGGIV